MGPRQPALRHCGCAEECGGPGATALRTSSDSHSGIARPFSEILLATRQRPWCPTELPRLPGRLTPFRPPAGGARGLTLGIRLFSRVHLACVLPAKPSSPETLPTRARGPPCMQVPQVMGSQAWMLLQCALAGMLSVVDVFLIASYSRWNNDGVEITRRAGSRPIAPAPLLPRPPARPPPLPLPRSSNVSQDAFAFASPFILVMLIDTLTQTMCEEVGLVNFYSRRGQRWGGEREIVEWGVCVCQRARDGEGRGSCVVE